MFSGKSEELIRRLRRAQIARQKVQIFKPLIDNRFSEDHIVSHSDMRIASENVRTSRRAARAGAPPTPKSSASTRGSSSTRSCRPPATRWPTGGKRVIVAGLDQDYLGRPFEPMPQLLAIAEYITKTLAICVVCGDPANHTQRLVVTRDRVLVGATGLYEARCRHCFDPVAGVRDQLRSRVGSEPPCRPTAAFLARMSGRERADRAVLLLLGAGFLIANARLLLRVPPLPAAPEAARC